MTLEEYTQYHEKKVHSEQGFPFVTYLCTIPQDFDQISPHWHDQMEIIYIKKGTGTAFVNLTAYDVEAGSIVLILPGQIHSLRGTPGVRMEYENLIFSLSMLDTPQAEWCHSACLVPLSEGKLTVPSVLAPRTKLHREVSDCLDELDEIGKKRVPGYPLLIKGVLFRLLYLFYTCGPVDTAGKVDGSTERIKQLLSWIAQHYTEPLSVTEAAQVAGYCPAHFMRFFKRCTGQTFVSYLVDYRLRAAAMMLAETDDSILSIAENCGFDSMSYFCRRFKARYGISPNEMRKQRKG